jgi:NAD(P)-dependent dehydrogenase (short-subunit alcohol dehydrogenase family)
MGLLDGRVAIVTGGGRGLGREHSLELARRGASVVIVDPGVGVKGEDVGEDPADEVVAEIRAAGGEAVAERASASDYSAIEQVVATTVERFGRLDAVVNNAGILRDRMLTGMTEEDFDAVIAVHLKGTFVLSKHACDHWRSLAKAGRPSAGRIINTTSGAGLFGNVGQVNYSAAKAGIVGMTLTTAMEMARYGVTCNAISPIAATRMTTGLAMTDAARAAADESDVPFDPLDPKAASPVVAYLASEESAWISGQVLRIEGDTVIVMQGFTPTATRFTAKGGGYLDAEELVTGMRVAYRAFPGGIPAAG